MTGPRTGPSRVAVLGTGVDAVSMGAAVERCGQAVEHCGYLSVGMLNAAKAVAMRRDEALRGAVRGCDLVLADGQSVVWAARAAGCRLPERVAGIDLFTELLAVASARGYRVYFLGARPEVLGRMLAVLGNRYPGLVVAGAQDGYFDPEDEAVIAEKIRLCQPDLLFIGMSSPRKEIFAARWGRATGARVVHGVGGSFDVLAGVTRRAPQWWQRHGLEWLFRAIQEPARLGRRYLATNAVFAALAAGQALRARAGRFAGDRGQVGGPADPAPWKEDRA